MKKNLYPTIHRDISWLSFNERVLQEAGDTSVPLLERVKFLGIYSSNQDEFFRVRVATLKRLANLRHHKFWPEHNPKKVLKIIRQRVLDLQNRFDTTFEIIRKELEKEKIFIIDETQLTPEQESWVRNYFRANIRPHLVPVMIDQIKKIPDLKDKSIYLVTQIILKMGKQKLSLIEIPTYAVPRFVVLPNYQDITPVMIIDDIIRLCMDEIFSFFSCDKIHSWCIKITRDAELDLDNDINSSLVEKLEKSLKKRKKGQPVRLVYDRNIKEDILSLLIQKLKLSGEDNIIPGGKYHNFKDFINFPVKGFEHLRYEPMPPLPHPFLENQRSIFDVVKKKDIMLFYPYQKFDYIIDLLREAAIDPDVVSIKITLYRLAKPSAIINALINAARNGKQVTVLVEIQARFDEEANIEWANLLQEEGVKVIFGVEGLKVHSKIFLITRKNGRKKEQLVHIGTGNFNENTAKLYSDISLITCRKGIVDEIEKVFEMFQSPFKQRKFKHLLISPLFMRQQLIEKIKHQIKLAKKGHRAYIGIKVNNLSDEEIIKYLYEASQAGVEIQLIVRSICSLIPQKKNLSENIQAKSIVDRFLEHARIFIFGAQEPEIYISSADLMLRNLDYRIEVATPVYDKKLKELLLKFFEIQWQDNQKARIIDEKFTNTILKDDQSPIRSQYYLYEFFNNFLYNNRTLKNLSLQKN